MQTFFDFCSCLFPLSTDASLGDAVSTYFICDFFFFFDDPSPEQRKYLTHVMLCLHKAD